MTIDNRSLDKRLDALDSVNADLDQTTRQIDPNENVDTVLSDAYHDLLRIHNCLKINISNLINKIYI